MRTYHFHPVARILSNLLSLPVLAFGSVAILRNGQYAVLTTQALPFVVLTLALVAFMDVVLTFSKLTLADSALEARILRLVIWRLPYWNIVSITRDRRFGLIPVNMIAHRRSGRIIYLPLLYQNRNDTFFAELGALVRRAKEAPV